MIFRQPPLSSVQNIFVLPLDVQVWKCLFVLLLFVFFIMALQLLHPLLKRKVTVYDVATFVWGAGSIRILAFESILFYILLFYKNKNFQVCQQGTHLTIPTTSGRFVVLTAFLAFLGKYNYHYLHFISDFINSYV